MPRTMHGPAVVNRFRARFGAERTATVVVEAPVVVRQPGGAPTTTYATVTTVPGRIWPAGDADERHAADSLEKRAPWGVGVPVGTPVETTYRLRVTHVQGAETFVRLIEITAVDAPRPTEVERAVYGFELKLPPGAAPASVAVTPDPAAVAAGGTLQLTATVRDASNNVLAGREIRWLTSDASKATVSASGLVTGVAGGSAVITAQDLRSGLYDTVPLAVTGGAGLSPVTSGLQLWLVPDAAGQQVTDKSGNGRHGVLGTTTGADTNDPALDLPALVAVYGGDDVVRAPAVSPAGGFHLHFVLDYRARQASNSWVWDLTERDVANFGILLRVINVAGGLRGFEFYAAVALGGAAGAQIFYLVDIPAPSWLDVAAEFEPTGGGLGTYRLIVNGEVITEVPFAMAPLALADPQLVTGAAYYNGTAGLSGAGTGGVLFYSRALTPAERATNRAYLRSLYPGLPA